jgi:hypothetical protein
MVRSLRWLTLGWLLLLSLPLAVQAGGVLVGPNVQITDAGLGDASTAESEVAIQGNSLYATWLDEREAGSSTQRPIYFARSDNGGQTWGTNKRVSLLSYVGFTERPVISVAPDQSIWIAWQLRSCSAIDPGECGNVDRENDVRLALSTDGGQTFGEFLAWDGADQDIEFAPAIHAENDRTLLLVANPNGSGADILLRVLTRNGNDLQAKTVKISEGIGNGRVIDGIIPDGPNMMLAVRGDVVCAAWEDRRSRFAIYGACSTNRGESFGPNVQISGSDDFNPRIAFGPDGTLYAAYQDAEEGPLTIRRSGDNGATWDTPNQAFALGNRVEIDRYDLDVDPAGQVLISVPLRVGSGFSSSSDLFLATSLNRGQSFALQGPLEDGQGKFPTVSTQVQPRTVIGSGPLGARAIVVWEDDRNSNEQIWATLIDLDSTPPSAPTNLQAQSGDTSILLTWNPSSDTNGVAGYHVLRATNPNGPFAQMTPRLVTATGYRDIGLDTTPYSYKVVAVDGTGNPSGESNVATATATVGTGFSNLNGTLAYNSGNNVALRSFAGANLGEQRIIGQGFLPVFSHDGQRVLLVREKSVISQRLDGSDLQTNYTAERNLGVIDTSADPNVIGAVHEQIYPNPNLVCIAFEPRMMRLQPVAKLYEESSPLASDVALSSDRSLMAYTYRNWCNVAASGIYDTSRLCIANTTTGNEQCLDGRDIKEVDFAPNSSTVVFSANFTGQNELWKAQASASGALSNFVQLTRGAPGQPASEPAVSTDGNWVVFVRDTDASAGEKLTLHVVRLDGDGLRSLNIDARDPAWAGGGSAAIPIPGPFRVLYPLVQK